MQTTSARIWATVAFLLAWLSSGAVSAELSGQALYLRYCAPCHGADAKGAALDGTAFAGRPRNLRDPALLAYSVDELVARLRDGSRLKLVLDPAALRARSTSVEEVYGHLRRLAQSNWSSIEQGWALYSKRCADCHGLLGEPPLQLPRGVKRTRDLASAGFQNSLRDAALKEAVRHGRGSMPGLTPQVTERESRVLATFVRFLSPGFRTYETYCATCHGDDGKGVTTVLGEVERTPTVVFNRNYFARNDPEAVRVRVWHMIDQKTPSMPHFQGVLGDHQLRAILGFLREAPGTP